MTSSKDKKKKPHGQIRQSHVVMTFGPGSMFLTLPDCRLAVSEAH